MAAEGDVDLIVDHAFFAKNSQPGVMVEVGAAHPIYLSVSKRFRDKGWQIVSVEPIPEFCAEHRKLGYDVVQCACSDHDDDYGTFYAIRSKNSFYNGGTVTYESFSSLGLTDQFAAHKAQINTETTEIPVVVRRLNRILEERSDPIQRIDVLSIDVEGWELSVLKGFDMARYRPNVIIIENNFSDIEQRKYITTHGYLHWATVSPNEIFVLPKFIEDTCNLAHAKTEFSDWVRDLGAI